MVHIWPLFLFSAFNAVIAISPTLNSLPISFRENNVDEEKTVDDTSSSTIAPCASGDCDDGDEDDHNKNEDGASAVDEENALSGKSMFLRGPVVAQHNEKGFLAVDDKDDKDDEDGVKGKGEDGDTATAPLTTTASSGDATTAPLITTAPGRKLELIHIRKTGGTALEYAAQQVGINWGACHWMNFGACHVSEPNRTDPNPDWALFQPSNFNFNFKGGDAPWHAPQKFFDPSPYNGSWTFAVVRDPYDRAVSEYYCPWAGYHGEDTNNPETMNNWIQNYNKAGSSRTQYSFVCEEGEKVIDHVLLYEKLGEQFAALMNQYGMPIRLVEHINVKTGQRLGKENMTAQTAAVVYEYHKEDFEAFGYDPKFAPGETAMSEGSANVTC